MTVTWILLGAALAGPPSLPPAQPLLEQGYREMYDLRFDQAHRSFLESERLRPEDPLVPVSDAAAYLFTEFERLHILQSKFFLDDDGFRASRGLKPDPELKRTFEARLEKSRQLADRILARNPHDRDAQFATVLRLGLHSDYLALVEERYVASFREMKAGRILAAKLLAGNPDYYDAYVAIGVENYLLSLKPAPVRWLLKIGGAQIDREEGLRKLRLTAQRGHYLLPFARLLLAVAALRDGDRRGARDILEGLSAEFPRNDLYREELTRLR
jgi:hypothetical protein